LAVTGEVGVFFPCPTREGVIIGVLVKVLISVGEPEYAGGVTVGTGVSRWIAMAVDRITISSADGS
jgi:hypothetical protein